MSVLFGNLHWERVQVQTGNCRQENKAGWEECCRSAEISKDHCHMIHNRVQKRTMTSGRRGMTVPRNSHHCMNRYNQNTTIHLHNRMEKRMLAWEGSFWNGLVGSVILNKFYRNLFGNLWDRVTDLATQSQP